MQYRAEIDGLRAVAVVPVILFHAGIPGFSGGFIGVDVFFVLSGYLITSIILREIQDGSFSLLNFWERRARRILPALFVMMLVCLPFAWVMMLPGELKDFGQSLVASVLFAANILFWQENGYFAGPADEKPLLHVWSLSVEEQFYLIFPLVLLMLRRRSDLTFWLALAAGGSFLLSDWGARHLPDAAYFLLPFRAWELLAGSLCALFLIRNRLRPNDLLSLVGLGLIGFGMFTLSGADAFPGRNALLPVLGTALVVLFCRPGGYVAGTLSHPWLVGIGLISYSFYLWHQPVFAFLRLAQFGALPMWQAFVALPGLVLVAWLSWRFVERPWRQRRGGVLVFGSSAAVAGMAAVVGVSLHLSGGVPGRLPQVALPPAKSAMPCHDRMTEGDCLIGDLTAQPSVLLIGDSHAGHLTTALDQILQARGQAMRVVSQSWCAPLLRIATDVPGRGAGCETVMRQALEQGAFDPEIDTIVLAAEWSNFLTGGRWGTVPVGYSDGQGGPGRVSDNPKVFAGAVVATAALLQGQNKTVVVVGPVPEYHLHVPKALARQQWWHGQYSLPSKHVLKTAQQQARSDQIAHYFERWPIAFSHWIDPAEVFCKSDECSYLSSAGKPLYRDDNHLSHAGALLLVQAILDRLPAPANGPDRTALIPD
ncbi:acyltransferase family protein [Halovulum sp. GXIMD14793]